MKVYLIGVGMGNPETLTVRALEAIRACPVLVGARRLLEECGVSLAMVTLGPRGCYLQNRRGSCALTAPQVSPVDTTGAGDIFGGSALHRLLDFRVPPEELDRAFACLCALSRGLLEQARPHAIVWADPRSGAVHCSVVTCPQELAGFLEEAFSLSAPAAGRSVLDGPISIPGEPGVVRRLHITPQWEGGSL